MKMMVLSSILVPFFQKRIASEFISISFMLAIPHLWASWDQPTPLSLGLVVDKLSLSLMLLTLWITMLMLYLKPSNSLMSLNVLLLLGSLLWFFSVSSLLLFFILFEASLIPTLCLIMGWGYQPERLEASYYFVFYTITFSMPLLVCIMWFVKVSGMKYFHISCLQPVFSSPFGFFVLLVFMIKLPLFMTHLWLPKAHVEAPVVGSMILAGVLLKTGGYGIARTFMHMKKSPVFLGFSVIGLIGMSLVCLACLCCMDMKQLIAFSSVSHMNFMVVGLMNNSLTAYSGSVMMMISHGVCSSLMFMLVDFSYKRCGSRSIIISKGLLMLAPVISLMWGITVLLNMGIPPSAGSLSELLIITAAKVYSSLYSSMFILYLFLSAFYSMYLYMCTNHGIHKSLIPGLTIKECFMSTSHLAPLVLIPLLTKFLLM